MKKLFILLLAIALLLSASTLVAVAAEEADRQQIPRFFHTYTEPRSDAGRMGAFAPQYVQIIQHGQDGWVQITTWLGPGWVNLTLPPAYRWTDACVDVIARMVWGEGRGVSRNEQKLIVWTVINRLEDGRYGDSLIGVVRARGQFHGYSPHFPVIPEIREMVVEVLEAWDRGEGAKVYPPFARTPDDRYFHGDGRHNWFRESWRQ